METTDRKITALINWINITFTCIDTTVESLKSLKSPIIVLNILKEIDKDIFEIPDFPEDLSSESSKIIAMSRIYNQIKLFYMEINEIKIEEDEEKFSIRQIIASEEDVDTDLETQSLTILAELILGIAAQCDNRIYYLQIMENKLDEEHSKELLSILNERISKKKKDLPKSDYEERDSFDEDQQMYNLMKIENLNIENNKLQEEIKTLHDKNLDQSKQIINLEFTIKDLEGRYQEMVYNIDMNKQVSVSQTADLENEVGLAMQISEMRGKLEAKEQLVKKLRTEKESLIADFKDKIFNLQKENDNLQEKSIKYDVLKSNMEKYNFEEINSLRNKLTHAEKIMKEQEERIKLLKNFDNDKVKLLKKIEDLNCGILSEKEKANELIRENNLYKETILKNEEDMNFYRKQINQYRTNDYEQELMRPESTLETHQSNAISLNVLEEEAQSKKSMLELETKLKMLTDDKETLHKEKTLLEEQVKSLSKQLEETAEELNKVNKKVEKYKKAKDENILNLKKITELTEKNHELYSKIEEMKIDKLNSLNEIEKKHNVSLIT